MICINEHYSMIEEFNNYCNNKKLEIIKQELTRLLDMIKNNKTENDDIQLQLQEIIRFITL